MTQCFLKNEAQANMLAANLELIKRLNPGWPVLLMDNCSPLDSRMCQAITDNVTDIHRFPDSIGHFSHKFVDERDPTTARDGPGRAIMTGIQMAIERGYDRLVYVEDDFLFAKPFEEGFAQMRKPVACLPRGKFGYLEWGVFWIKDLAWFKQYDFIGRYDWPNQKQGPGREGERIYEAILGEHLQVLPYKGARGEGYINAANLSAVFPNGADYLTHVTTDTFAAFLRMNGQDDLAEKLT